MKEDKRTWRGGREREDTGGKGGKGVVWTAMDVLVAFALKKGWVTAKAGRPDIHRAGNYSKCPCYRPVSKSKDKYSNV